MLCADPLMFGCFIACLRSLETTKQHKNASQRIILHDPGTGQDDLIGHSFLAIFSLEVLLLLLKSWHH